MNTTSTALATISLDTITKPMFTDPESVTLDDVANAIANLSDALGVHEILFRWKIGEIVDYVIENEAKFGDKAVKKLAEKLDNLYNPSQLYEFRRVRKAYEYDDLVELVRECQEEGINIGWVHIASITALPDESSRKKVLDEFIEEGGWTVRDLRERIQEETGKKSKGGRKPKAPESFDKALKSMITSADSFTNKLDTIRGSLEEIKKKDIQKWMEDEKLVEKYNALCAECLKSLASSAEALNDALEEVERIHKVMCDEGGN